MIKSLKKLANECGFKYVGNDVSIENITINTNDVGHNSMFAAIIANRDGHEFIPSALANGAKAILVSKEQYNISVPQVVCSNTIKGLRALATTYRKSLNMPIIALTGSCGKTSVKEMIVTLLSDKQTHSTFANFNNYLGVPMTILETPHSADFAIIEAGTSVYGEIKAAAEIIKPDVALITNVGASHLENLINIDGVMQEKGELLKELSSTGHCIVNLDDENIAHFTSTLSCNKITCSMINNQADIYVKEYSESQGKYCISVCILGDDYKYELPAIGKHNIGNSLLAIASIIATGMKPNQFLHNTTKIDNYKGRFSIVNLNENLTMVDDTYNASVSAVKAAIDDLSGFDGKKILVLSSMKELGDFANKYHQEVGELISQFEIDNILLFGDIDCLQSTLDAAANSCIEYFELKSDLNSKLYKILNNYKNKPTKVIIKGARSYKMEEIVAYVSDNFSK